MRRFIALLSLAACSYMAPTTAARLATLDPLTADPSQIEVAILFPPGLNAHPGSAKLEIKAQRGADHLDGLFTLAERGQGPGPKADPGAKMVIYGITAKDAALMRDWQTKVADWKAEEAASGKTAGSLGIAIEACTMGQGPTEDAKGSALIRLDKSGDFLPLIQQAPLAEILGPEAMAAIRPCHSPD